PLTCADLDVRQAGNLDRNTAVNFGLHVIHVRGVAEGILRRDLVSDAPDGLGNSVGDLSRVAAGADGDGVVAFVRGIGEVAGNVLIQRVQGIFHVAARVAGEAFQRLLVLVREPEGHRAYPIDGDQVALREFQNLVAGMAAGGIVPI